MEMNISALSYPLDVKLILRKRRSIRADLLKQTGLQEIKIAILGGSTTSEVCTIIELFLLKSGFRPQFLESDYGQYFETSVFNNAALKQFGPDLVFVYTTSVNVNNAPSLLSSEDECNACLSAEVERYESIWDSLSDELGCLIIQNNFDLPRIRSLGGLDMTEQYGRSNFLLRLNLEFAAAARKRPELIIQDILHLSARIGLDQWFDEDYWFSYKLAVSHTGTVHLAHQFANLVSAAYGKVRKCLVLDLDNTLWGGVIGDDAVDGIKLGQGSAHGEAFSAFQTYCHELHARGVILSVCSKNELDTAKEGLSHPDSILSINDLSAIYANWEAKSENIVRIGKDLNIGLDSLVFVDDNPAERSLVSSQLPPVAVPDIGSEVSRFAEYLDREGYFEVAKIDVDDVNRADFYAGNKDRSQHQSKFSSYSEFLVSLDMTAEIGPVGVLNVGRVASLVNKTNQYNLTTKRYSVADIEGMAFSEEYITLYGRLKDRFGDNGLVSVVSGKVEGETLHIDLWLMSCRVLKRNFEFAMLDALVARALRQDVNEVVGYYNRTPKNGMVENHYEKLGFEFVSRSDDELSSVWKLRLEGYKTQNKVIKESKHV
mgnify:FL=1